jgi:HlyD family secretion protein
MVKRIVILVVLALVVLGLWAALRPRATAVDLGRVERGAVRESVEEEGMTRVIERYVVAAPLAGRLLRVGVSEGDQVKQGDIVAEIDPLPLKSKVLETKAEINALKKRLEGVDKKKPKAEELERAQTLEKVAQESLLVSESELDESKATLDRAVQDKQRVEKLIKASAATLSELDAAVAAEAEARARMLARTRLLDVQKARVLAARLATKLLEARLSDFEWEKKAYLEQIRGMEATLQVLQDDLAHAKIAAPVDGTILTLIQESQRVVQAGTMLLEVGDLSELEVEVDFLSEDVAHMRVGMPAEVFGRALGGEVLPGRIKRIYPSAFRKISSLGVEQQRVKVVVEIDEKKPMLGDRFRVEARVVLKEKKDAVLVPEGALFRNAGRWHVFKVEAGKALLTGVETGLRDGLVREVTGGLTEGDTVILHPDESLADGSPVEGIGQ